MSILTQVLHGKISPLEGITEAIGWGQKVAAQNPAIAAPILATVDGLHTAAYAAQSLTGTASGTAVANVTPVLEDALDKELATLTGGATVPFNGLINDGLDRISAAVHAEIDAYFLKYKASLFAPTTPAS